MKFPKDIFKRIGQRQKKKSTKRRIKRAGGYRSREEFEADFERRFGKPGRIPEDV